MKFKWTLVLGLALATVLLFAAVVVQILSQPYAFQGSVIDPPKRAPDIVLTTHTGKPFRLSDQTGKAVVLFFGYTSCPDVCPTTLYTLKRVHAQLTTQADQVRFVLITVDPDRDTMERMAVYVPNFEPSFIGLTGTLSELEPVWKSYGVYRAKQAGGTALGYLVDHSSRIYVIDTHGNLRVTYTHDTPPEHIARDLRHLLKETPASTAHPTDAGDTMPGGVITHGNLKIEKVWTRPATKPGTVGVYLSITNTGAQADALIEANSLIARLGEIHETRMESDVMKMQRVFRIDLPPGQKIDLKPGGYHIMLTTLMDDVRPGTRIPVNLIFEHAGKVSVEAEVISP